MVESWPVAKEWVHSFPRRLISCYHCLISLPTLRPSVFISPRGSGMTLSFGVKRKKCLSFFRFSPSFSMFRQKQMAGLLCVLFRCFVFCYTCEYLCLEVSCILSSGVFKSLSIFLPFFPLTSVITLLPKPYPFPRYRPHHLWVLLQ